MLAPSIGSVGDGIGRNVRRELLDVGGLGGVVGGGSRQAWLRWDRVLSESSCELEYIAKDLPSEADMVLRQGVSLERSKSGE